MSEAGLEVHVKEFLTNKTMSAQVLVTLTGKLVSQVALKNMSLEDKKKAVCEALENALKNNSTGMPTEELTGLTYVVKNVVPHLVELLGGFSVNAIEKKLEKEVLAVATSYWASCLSCLPAAFRGQAQTIAAEAVKKVEAAAPELVKKAEEVVAPVVAEAVKKAEEVVAAAPEVVKKVEEAVAAAPEVVKKVEEVVAPEDIAAKVPDWSAPADVPAPATESSNPV
jgi:Arc/MetJ family transcription regulator